MNITNLLFATAALVLATSCGDKNLVSSPAQKHSPPATKLTVSANPAAGTCELCPARPTPEPSQRAPVADAGANQSGETGQTFTLDGGGSSDADGDPLSYQWREHSDNPVAGLLSSTTGIAPTFTPTVAGTYTFDLVVNDGQQDSAPGQVAITVEYGLTALRVTHTGDSGEGSLRQILLEANAQTGTDIIVFDLPGAGPHTLRLQSGLPEIADPLVLDGTTAPAFTGVPIIELDGTEAGDASGLLITADNTTVRGLVINRFAGHGGIWLIGSGATITGNYIGTDPSGTEGLGNSGGGIIIDGADNVIGGTTVGEGNVISSNEGAGIEIHGEPATANRIEGNYIGTDAAGSTALGNPDGVVVHDGAAGNTIGGTAMGAGNIISGNGGAGVRVLGEGTSENQIEGNYIGTDAAGTTALGNAEIGIIVDAGAAGNTIGGTQAGAGNVISGHLENLGRGVWLISSHNTVAGNYIGTDAAGTAALGNVDGLVIEDNAQFNTVGGTQAGAGNTIAASTDLGIWLIGSDNTIAGNYIGTDLSGTQPLGNGSDGIRIDGTDNTIGGTDPDAGNTIAFNGQNGVSMLSGTGNTIQSNAFFANAAAGIDLGGDGLSPNDPTDGDSGPNHRQNTPQITVANLDSNGNLSLGYRVDSAPTTSTYPLTIQLFWSDTDQEGKTLIGEDLYTLDDFAQNDRALDLGSAAPLGFSKGAALVATATDAAGNTSEFSAAYLVRVQLSPAAD